MFKQLSLVLAAVLTQLSLSACNTLAGVGRDIEKAGEGIQGAAKK